MELTGGSKKSSYAAGSPVPVEEIATFIEIAVIISTNRPDVTIWAVYGNITSSGVSPSVGGSGRWTAVLLDGTRGSSSSAPGGGGSTAVRVTGALSSRSVGELSFMSAAVTMTLSFVWAIASGQCIPPDFEEHVVLSWPMIPVLPASQMVVATQSTFRASTIVSSMLGNPVATMTTTSMMSMLSLESCLFSDVDPLEPAVSPFGEIAKAGDEIGQYYRGTAVAGLGVYLAVSVIACASAFALSHFSASHMNLPLKRCFATLRFPSIGMMVVSVFGQGIASCGVSLLRLQRSNLDVLLGVVALGVCMALVVFSGWITSGRRFLCRTERQSMSKDVPIQLLRFMRLATWSLHWKEPTRISNDDKGFKRRYFMLMDDLCKPWWTSVELSSSLIHGAVLGIRINSLSICSMQLWLMVIHTLGMLVTAAYLRPCGAYFSNMFLIASKVGAFAVAAILLLQTAVQSDFLPSAAEVVTTIFTGLASLQAVVMLITTIISLLPSIRAFTRKLTNCDNVTSAAASHTEDGQNHRSTEERVQCSKLQDDEAAQESTIFSFPFAEASLRHMTMECPLVRAQATLLEKEMLELLLEVATSGMQRPRHERLQLLIAAASKSGASGRSIVRSGNIREK